jgi:hypothetical protein
MTESKSPQVNFEARLATTHERGRMYLILQLFNHTSWTVWIDEVSVVLAALDANLQTEAPTGQARHRIFQNVGPNEALGVSLAETMYDAAGRPQGRYSCSINTGVRYRVLDEWCDAKLEPCHIEMEALTVVALHGARWYDKRIKQKNGLVGLAMNVHRE